MKRMNIALPRIAVLLATFNGGKYLREQLDSIFAQEDVDIRVYARDDHSSDNTVAILNEYADSTGKLVVLLQEPNSLYAAKNFMSVVRDVDFSHADYICYSDQDDIWLPQKIIAAIEAMTANNVDCYASNLIMAGQDGKPLSKHSLTARLKFYLFNYKTNRKLKYDHYFESASAGCTLVLGQKAALWLQKIFTQHFTEIPREASHDWSTYAATRLAGFQWFIDPRSYILYRQHAQNAYGANIGMGGVRKLLEWFENGRYRNHILMIDALYNKTGQHPPFIKALKEYNRSSMASRCRLAFAISGYRRKFVHRIMLFVIIMVGYMK